jgi:hypothetical protein
VRLVQEYAYGAIAVLGSLICDTGRLPEKPSATFTSPTIAFS